MPRLVARITEPRTYALSVVVAILSALLFAADQSLPAVLAAIALLGFAVGGVFAVMPKLVLAGVPRAETASVLSINQIARSIGMSIGSALAGFLLAATTAHGAMLPTRSGYVTAARGAIPPLTASVLVIAVAGTIPRSSARPACRGYRAGTADMPLEGRAYLPYRRSNARPISGYVWRWSTEEGEFAMPISRGRSADGPGR